MSETNGEIPWGTLGEQRWRELGAAAGASELQLRFAVARFGGASATAAARLAGYAGTDVSLRRAGYDAVRSTAVQNLLELAAVNAPEDARISEKEIDARIAKLIKSSDPNVSLKAMDAHAKRQAVRREFEAEGSKFEPMNDIRYLLGLLPPYSLHVVACFYLKLVTKHGPRISPSCGYFPLFDQVAPNIAQEWPDLWAKMMSRLDDDCRAEAEAFARRPLCDLEQFDLGKSAGKTKRTNGGWASEQAGEVANGAAA